MTAPEFISSASLLHVLAREVRQEHPHALAHERRGHQRLQRLHQRADPLARFRAAAADQHVAAVGLEHAPVLGERAVADVVEDQVVAHVGARVVIPGVVDHVVRAEGADQLDVARAADGGHLGAHRIRDLHCEGADAARGAVDQHLVTRLEPARVAQSLQRGGGGDRDCSRLLDADIGRPECHCAVLLRDYVLRERAGATAENLVARLEPRDVAAHCFDGARVVHAEPNVLRLAQSGAEPHQVGRAAHVVPVERVDRRRVHADEQFVVAGHGFLDVIEPEHVGGAVVAVDDGLRRYPGNRDLAAIVVGKPVTHGESQHRHQGDRKGDPPEDTLQLHRCSPPGRIGDAHLFRKQVSVPYFPCFLSRCRPEPTFFGASRLPISSLTDVIAFAARYAAIPSLMRWHECGS